MKKRQTVNNLEIRYDENTDEITLTKNDQKLTLKMGEDQLNLLYQMTPYYRYKKFLLREQDFRCADCNKSLEGLKASKFALHHDPPLGRKGSRYVDFDKTTQNRILCNSCHGKIDKKSPIKIPNKMQNARITSTVLSEKLNLLGYEKYGTRWQKGEKIVNVLKSSQYGEKVRISWYEHWKNDYATIFDFTKNNGPICIIPISDLFATDFIAEKRQAQSYINSGYRWTQLFPKNHPLVRFILAFQNYWAVLE